MGKTAVNLCARRSPRRRTKTWRAKCSTPESVSMTIPNFDGTSLIEAFAAYRATVNAAPAEDDEATNSMLW